MFIVHVHFHVTPEFVEDFMHATRINTKSGIKEPGVARFDVIQELDDPTRFFIIEVFSYKG